MNLMFPSFLKYLLILKIPKIPKFLLNQTFLSFQKYLLLPVLQLPLVLLVLRLPQRFLKIH